MKKFLILAFLFSSFGFASQGQLQGTWTAPCKKRELNFQKNILTFSDSRFQIMSEDFKDDCGTPSKVLSVRVPGTFEVLDERSSGGWQFKLTVEQVFLTVFDPQTIESLNKIGFCGHSDWQVGIERTCEEAVDNSTPYAVYAIDGNRLSFSSFFATLAELENAVIDPNNFLEKQVLNQIHAP